MLGYKIKKVLEKHRTEYKLKNVCFEIDTYLSEPTLLEIESPNKKTDLRNTLKNQGSL